MATLIVAALWQLSLKQLCNWNCHNLVTTLWQGCDKVVTKLCCMLTLAIPGVKIPTLLLLPRVRMRSKGLCDRSWCLYIIYLQKNFELFFYLSKYSQEGFSSPSVYFSSSRSLRVQCKSYVSLPSGYRVSIVRNTNIDQIETTPLRYCMLHARYGWTRLLQAEALGKWIYMLSWPGA